MKNGLNNNNHKRMKSIFWSTFWDFEKFHLLSQKRTTTGRMILLGLLLLLSIPQISLNYIWSKITFRVKIAWRRGSIPFPLNLKVRETPSVFSFFAETSYFFKSNMKQYQHRSDANFEKIQTIIRNWKKKNVSIWKGFNSHLLSKKKTNLSH